MKTRIGRSPSLVNRKQNAPNIRLRKGAQERLDNVVDRANQRHANALAVDGIEFFIFRRQRAGHLCTCFGSNQTGSAQIVGSNEDGVSEQDQYIQTEVNDGGISEVVSIADMQDDDDEFSMTTLQDDRKAKAEIDYSTLLEDEDYASSATDKYFDIDEIENIPPDGVGQTVNDPFMVIDEDEDEFMEIDESADQRAKLTRTLESLLTGGEQTPCGICFSTGWTEGYELLNGRRIALTTHTVNSLGGFEIDRTQYPNVFIGTTTSDPVQWTIDLPRYFSNALRIGVWDNLNPAASVRLYAKYTGTSEFVPVTRSSLNARRGMNNKGTVLQVFPTVADGATPESLIRFTHVELLFETSDRIIGQMPQIEIAETFDSYEAIVNTNVELPARISMLNVGSAIVDQKHHRTWRVVAISQNKTAKGQIFSIEAQLQMISQKEPLDRLNVYRNYYVTTRNYKGLERTQGGRQTGFFDERARLVAENAPIPEKIVVFVTDSLATTLSVDASPDITNVVASSVSIEADFGAPQTLVSLSGTLETEISLDAQPQNVVSIGALGVVVSLEATPENQVTITSDLSSVPSFGGIEITNIVSSSIAGEVGLTSPVVTNVVNSSVESAVALAPPIEIINVVASDVAMETAFEGVQVVNVVTKSMDPNVAFEDSLRVTSIVAVGMNTEVSLSDPEISSIVSEAMIAEIDIGTIEMVNTVVESMASEVTIDGAPEATNIIQDTIDLEAGVDGTPEVTNVVADSADMEIILDGAPDVTNTVQDTIDLEISLPAEPEVDALWTLANLSTDVTLELNFDAQDAGSFTKDGSNIISQWDDLSGNGRHANNPTAADRPLYTATNADLNNHPTVSNIDAGDGFVLGPLGDYSVPAFWVLALDSGNVYPGLARVYGSAITPVPGNHILATVYPGGGIDATNDIHWVDGTLHATILAQVDPDPVDAGALFFAGRINTFNLGAAEGIGAFMGGTGMMNRSSDGITTSDCDYGEIIYVKGTLAAAERELIEGYLAWKWGIVSELDASHPYKSAAPRVSDSYVPA